MKPCDVTSKELAGIFPSKLAIFISLSVVTPRANVLAVEKSLQLLILIDHSLILRGSQFRLGQASTYWGLSAVILERAILACSFNAISYAL